MHTYRLGNTAQKKLWLEIKAEKKGTNILLTEATLTYPEKILEIKSGRN